MIKKLVIIHFLTLALSFAAFSQIPNGSWRDHLSYYRAISIAVTPDKIFCGFNESGLLSFHRKTGEIEKLSKVNNLSDIDISKIYYAKDPKILVIGYTSGNIDLLTHEGPINMPDIVRKSMIGSKRINAIEGSGNLAYLASDFGIVVLDLLKKEVKDSYQFGPDGSPIQVNDLTLTDEFIYAATSLGLYRVSLNSTNLLDYSNWTLLTDLPEPNTPVKHVEAFNNSIFCVYYDSQNNTDQILTSTGNGWTKWNNFNDTLILGINSFNQMLSITGYNYSAIYNSSMQILFEKYLNRCFDALIDETGRVYTASYGKGFCFFEGDYERGISTICPRFNITAKISAKHDQVWAGSGGPFRPWDEGGGHNFFNEKWTSLNAGWEPGLDGVGNFYKIVYDPSNQNHIYASSYLFGLYEITDLKVSNSHTMLNTEIFRQTIDPAVGVRIMGLDFDSKGILWAIFDITDQPVYSYNPVTREWTHYELKSSVFGSANKYVDLVVADNDQIWILSRNEGMIVLQKESDNTFKEKSFALKNSNGEALGVAYCLTKDKKGNILVGTNKGPASYSSGSDIFNNPDPRAYQVIIPRNDGTGLGDYLLDFEIINEIAIDGANRKWIATESSGVFLISEDGKKTIHQFTSSNSPLFSNNVIGVDIQQNTGEVFISTNRGTLSYKGQATEGESDYSNVFVFPNPVRPGYSGDITISGLVENSVVKITDISGNLVFETISLGGQAIWNGKNFDGKRVSTGVYLVFLSTEDGNITHITKLLFIH